MAGLTRRELLLSIPIAAAVAKAKAGDAQPSELWDIAMTLDIPRIYNNMSSQGYRKYQRQRLRGRFGVFYVRDGEPEIRFYGLENLTHKVNGACVTYDVVSDAGILWHGVGNNRTGKFATRSVKVEVEAMPSYAIGAADEDNTLVLTLAGRGYSNGNRIRGYAAGQLGCGCYAYGHVSPTRIWGQDRVVDTAAAFGTWTAKRVCG